VSGCDRAAGGSGEVNLASHSKRKASRFCKHPAYSAFPA